MVSSVDHQVPSVVSLVDRQVPSVQDSHNRDNQALEDACRVDEDNQVAYGLEDNRVEAVHNLLLSADHRVSVHNQLLLGDHQGRAFQDEKLGLLQVGLEHPEALGDHAWWQDLQVELET